MSLTVRVAEQRGARGPCGVAQPVRARAACGLLVDTSLEVVELVLLLGQPSDQRHERDVQQPLPTANIYSARSRRRRVRVLCAVWGGGGEEFWSAIIARSQRVGVGRSFVHAFARSFFRSFFFVRSHIRWFVGSLVRSFVRSFVRSLVRTFVRSIVLLRC